MTGFRFNVFGRRVLLTRRDDQWLAFYLGDEGKRRLANDIVVPSGTAESDLAQYLADLFHEWSSPEHPDVTRLG